MDVLIRNPRRDHKKSASGGQAWTVEVPGLTKPSFVDSGRSIPKEDKLIRKNQCHISILLLWKKYSGTLSRDLDKPLVEKS